MGKPSDKNHLMERLDEQGLPPAEIALRVGVSYSTAYGFVVARREGFTSYFDYLANEKAKSDPQFVKFLDGQPPSAHLYRVYIVQRRLERTGSPLNPKPYLYSILSDYGNFLAERMAEKDLGYKSFLDERGIPPSRETRKRYLLFKKGVTDAGDKAALARRKAKSDRYFRAFLQRENIQPSAVTYGGYQAYQAAQRQQRLPNKIVRWLITAKLAALGKDQRWLARYLKVTDAAVSRYANGKTTPRVSLQPRLFEALELPYRTVDALVKDLTGCPPAQLAGKLGLLGIADGIGSREGLEGILDGSAGEPPAGLSGKVHPKAREAAAGSRQGIEAYSRQGTEPAPIDLLMGLLISAKLHTQGMTPEELAGKLGMPERKLFSHINGRLPNRKMQPHLFKALGLPYKAVGGIVEDSKQYPPETLLEKWGLNDETDETITTLEGLLGRVRGSSYY